MNNSKSDEKSQARDSAVPLTNFSKLKRFLIEEITGFTKSETIFYSLIIIVILIISCINRESWVGILNALTGVIFVLLNGKGKRSCYIFGLINSVFFSYISFSAALYGDAALYTLYYIPVYVIGFILWSKNIKKENDYVVEKRRLNNKWRILLVLACTIAIFVLAFVLSLFGDSNPILDSICTSVSIIAMLVEINRYCEQWPLWALVNASEVIMWTIALIIGAENALSTLCMWIIFLILSFYYWYKWEKSVLSHVQY